MQTTNVLIAKRATRGLFKKKDLQLILQKKSKYKKLMDIKHSEKNQEKLGSKEPITYSLFWLQFLYYKRRF